MKPLHRPMFKYGGPIKEGIMSGIREPRANGGRAALVGNPMFPQRGGRALHAEQLSLWPNLVESTKKTLTTNPLKVVNPLNKRGKAVKVAKKFWPKVTGWWARNKPTTKFRHPSVKQHPGSSFKYEPRPYSAKEIAMNPKLWWRAAKENPKTAIGMGYGAITDPGQAVITKGIPGALKWGAEALTPGFAEKWLPWNQEKDLPPPPEGDGTSIFKTEEVIEPKKSDEEIRAERIQKYRDIMDIKGMNKEAAANSLIEASRLISESGDFKGDLKSGKLINQIIQGASKAFDKPKATKDAIDTLILKGEIEADIASGKAGTYQKNIDTIAESLNISKADATKMMLNKPLDLREQVTTDMAATKQAAVTHKGLISSTKKQFPNAQVMMTTEEKDKEFGDEIGGEEIIKTKITESLTKDPNAKVAGVYIVGKEVIQVDGAGNTLTLFP